MTDDDLYAHLARIASDAKLVIPLEHLPAVATYFRERLEDSASCGVVADYLRALSRQKPLVSTAPSQTASEVLPISEDNAPHNFNNETESPMNE